MSKKPKCPICGKPTRPGGNKTAICTLGHVTDENPNEGGTHDDRDPSRRLQREEEIQQALAFNDQRRAENSGRGFRFRR